MLAAIKNAKCTEEFNRLNFKPVTYIDAKGEERPAMEMSRNGFMFTGTMFTGELADQLREKIIVTFDEMELEIQRRREADLVDFAEYQALLTENAELKDKLLDVQGMALQLMQEKHAPKPKRALAKPISPAEIKSIREMKQEGMSNIDIARHLGRSPATVCLIGKECAQ